MAVFRCKMCGGSLEVAANQTTAVCEYCGTIQTLPRLNDERIANLYDRANHFRRNNDYDKALGIYEQILCEDRSDSEAYWSIVLCRYGIEYVEDPTTKKRIPTINRTQLASIFSDADYRSAILYADDAQKEIYEAEAKAIDDIQKRILEVYNSGESFDIFICYKDTDNNGRRTPDSVLANDLYNELTEEGYKVFFSRITLEDKLGEEFEGVISSVTNFGIFVELENTVEGLIKVEDLPDSGFLLFEKQLKLKGQKMSFSVGDKVFVKLVSANIYTRKIDFSFERFA